MDHLYVIMNSHGVNREFSLPPRIFIFCTVHLNLEQKLTSSQSILYTRLLFSLYTSL